MTNKLSAAALPLTAILVVSVFKEPALASTAGSLPAILAPSGLPEYLACWALSNSFSLNFFPVSFAFFMASSLQKLVQASKQNVENVIQLRREFAEKAAQVVDKAGKKKGISAENLDFIKREIFGIV